MREIKTTYLAAGQALGKTYTPDGVTPYPLVKRFTTMDVVTPATMDGMKQRLAYNRRHAVHGNAILRGNTTRPLQFEARAGAVDAMAANPVLILDVDNLLLDDIPAMARGTTRQLANRILALLPEPFQEASCLCSASSSMGTKPGVVSMHFEFWLTEAQVPQWHRNLLRHLNLIIPAFRSQLTLSASGTAFRWKVDPAMASNAQIRYIAVPQFLGDVENPIPDVRDRHFMIRGKQVLLDTSRLEVPSNIDSQVTRAMNEFRGAHGLPPKREAMAFIGSADNRTAVVTNPDRVHMTYVRDTDKFVYYNINGGDSNAYYVRKFEPHVVFNFKGEPPFIFEAADPEAYKQHFDRWILDTAAGKKDNAPPLPILFREPTVDTYYSGLIEVGTGRIIEMNPIRALKAMQDFMAQRDAPMPDPIPEYYYRFDPDQHYTFDPVGRRINKYRAPELDIAQIEPFDWQQASEWARSACPNIRMLMLHVLGGDEESFHRFFNWIAAIFQTKQKLSTAWVLQGCQGTGKGILFNQIISRVFGQQYSKLATIDALEEQFNAQFEDALMVMFDEFRLDTSKLSDKVYNKLKNMIGEKTIFIREMRQTRVQRTVYFNCLFASNDRDIVRIPQDDRRFNVAPRQNFPLNTVVDIPLLLRKIEEELSVFIGGLSVVRIDENILNVPMMNKARKELQQLSETTVDEFVNAINDGDLEYFLDAMRMDHLTVQNPLLAASRAIIRRWLDREMQLSVRDPDTYEHHVAIEDLRVLYSLLVSPIDSIKKFGRMLSIHGLSTSRIRSGVDRARVATINWQLTAEHYQFLKEQYVTSQLPNNVQHLR